MTLADQPRFFEFVCDNQILLTHLLVFFVASKHNPTTFLYEWEFFKCDTQVNHLPQLTQWLLDETELHVAVALHRQILPIGFDFGFRSKSAPGEKETNQCDQGDRKRDEHDVDGGRSGRGVVEEFDTAQTVKIKEKYCN